MPTQDKIIGDVLKGYLNILMAQLMMVYFMMEMEAWN